MKCVPTLARTAALAVGAMILSSGLAAAPAQAAVTHAICTSADAAADEVYKLALKSPHLYPTPADAAAAAKASYTRRVLSENGSYTGTGRGVGEFHRAQSLCRAERAAPTGPWV